MREGSRDTEGQASRYAGELWAISPLDGRYGDALAALRPLVSEGALIFYRIKVECAWLLFLSKLGARGDFGRDWQLSAAEKSCLERLSSQPLDSIARRVKEVEAVTNHDVKAVEYVIREELAGQGAAPTTLALIHFACTSEDINNLAYALMLQDVSRQLILPALRSSLHMLAAMSQTHHAQPMLGRTHGQPATPTTLGKELAVFGYRLLRQYRQLKGHEFCGKLNGAVGNYNAHYCAAPQLNWRALSQQFIEDDLGLTWNPWTTQIENHDFIAEYCNKLRLTNSIGIDLVRDLWTYVGLGYFKQKVKANEVGSSIMPHKVNPIDFENAEGNFGLSSAMAEHFSAKLPISRMQRDLSDSTVLRNLGTIAAYHLLAQRSLQKGLGKLEACPQALDADLSGAWEVLAEPLQTMLRSAGVVDAYELLKEKTRGKQLKQADYATLVTELADLLPAAMHERLRQLTPASYVGVAPALAQDFAALVASELGKA